MFFIHSHKFKKYYGPVTLIALSFVLVLPQIMTKGLIIGSDSLFHYNRFYDTAMQIKEGNFQPFLSIYGFQQSGRIVNALYGPLMAYFQGLLVLISPSWFGYQIISRFVLYVMSSLSMYTLLRRANVRMQVSVLFSTFFMTTFAIEYWTMRQGFSSWGAALLPLCLLPIIDFATKKQVNWLQLAICTALMTQTHMFTTLLLAMIYLPFFCYAWLTTDHKWRLFKQMTAAISTFFLLTLNLWWSFYIVYTQNKILPPFVNRNLFKSTIDRQSTYWLVTPMTLTILLLVLIILISHYWRSLAPLIKISFLTACGFLLLSTSLVPWEYLQEKGFKFVETIQFPFRFFVPFTILFIFCLALVWQKYLTKKAYTWLLLVIVSVGVCQTIRTTMAGYTHWNEIDVAISTGKHTSFQTEDNAQVKAALYDDDLTQLLNLVTKSTPDYVPIYEENDFNKYRQYEKRVINRQQYFTKSIEQQKLTITWHAKKDGTTEIPIIKYAHTELMLNDRLLTDDEITLSTIGTPKIPQKSGENRLVVTFADDHKLTFPIMGTIIAWLTSFIVLAWQKIRK